MNGKRLNGLFFVGGVLTAGYFVKKALEYTFYAGVISGQLEVYSEVLNEISGNPRPVSYADYKTRHRYYSEEDRQNA